MLPMAATCLCDGRGAAAVPWLQGLKALVKLEPPKLLLLWLRRQVPLPLPLPSLPPSVPFPSPSPSPTTAVVLLLLPSTLRARHAPTPCRTPAAAAAARRRAAALPRLRAGDAAWTEADGDGEEGTRPSLPIATPPVSTPYLLVLLPTERAQPVRVCQSTHFRSSVQRSASVCFKSVCVCFRPPRTLGRI